MSKALWLAAARLDRRDFVRATAGFGLWALATRGANAVVRDVRFASDPFTLGVASGDPSSDGFVLWTRLAPDPLAGGQMPSEAVEVRWEIADDEGMQRIVRSGTAVAKPELAHSVHVEVEGLPADRWYFYRFHAGDATSRVGRARTAPPADALPDRLRFAFASCQHYETGYFTAYKHMLEDDLDLVVHLGDYIYEGAGIKGRTRMHVGPKLDSLEDYRNRYAQYRSDEHLQAAHARFPWLVTWDDHELENNCAGDISQDKDISTEQFLAQRARAYQAYYEHMPLRAAQLPDGPHLKLYRSCAFGRLAAFQVLDTRQYRSDQPCGDGKKAPCAEVFAQSATVLGQAQEKWLVDRLVGSEARWNILAQQIMMGRVDRAPGEPVGWSMDQWSGYDVPRTRLLSTLADAKIANPVVLTGDIHSNWVNDLKVDFDNPQSPVIATEFVGTSISSGGDGADRPKGADQTLAENPFVKFFNAQRGYVRCDVRANQWHTDYCVLDQVSQPESKFSIRASFVVEAGRPGAQQVS
ncbi:MAG: alkaline phosphatase D family protein [Aureliella sp.]